MGSGGDISTTYGILCHRQYSDRVRDALLYNNSFNWLQLSSSQCSNSQQISQTSKLCIDIPTSEHIGPRKARSGYSLFVIHNATLSPGDLPPMARKQISWSGSLQYQFSNFSNINGSSDGDTTTYKHLILEIWKELSKTYNATNVYRVDVQPKSYSSDIITAFITHINEILQDKINLSLSASKVTNVVNIVIQSTTTDIQSLSSSDSTQHSPIQTAYWGISNAKEHFADLNQRINDNANKDIVLETTDETIGVDKRVMNDSSQDVVDVNVPVSRAYYKLAQVFEDDSLIDLIQQHNGNKEVSKNSILSHGSGLDIGASPGGWTQVLHNTLGMSSVVAVDPGILANRVMKLNGVHHIRAELSTDISITGLASHAPYSVIVCDASISDANELLIKIAETLKKVSSMLLSDDDEGKRVIALPLCLVITLKLPYKTSGSIDRNLAKVNNYIPEYLEQIAKLGGDNVVVRHKICHLFANSTSERSLVAVFYKK